MYRRALQKDLRFGEAYYRLALAEINLAAYGDAVRSLRRAVELEPDNTDAAVKLADIYMVAVTRTGTQPRLAEGSEGAGRQAGAKESEVLRRAPHRGADCALLQNDAAGAVEQIEAATQIKPDETDLAMAYFQALVANKQADQAEKMGLTVIDKNKNFAPMYDVLYFYYMKAKRVPEAERHPEAEGGKQSEAVATTGCNWRRIICSRKQKRSSSKKPFRAAERMKSNIRKAILLAGDFYFYRTRDFDGRAQQYEAGEKAFPQGTVDLPKAAGGTAGDAPGKNPEANQMLATILKENPKDSDAVAMRAALMLTTGDLAQINQAVNDLQSLVAKTPDNHLLRFNLARAYLAKNDLDQARLQLEAAVKLRPDFVVARDMLARVYLARKRLRQGVEGSRRHAWR